MKAFQLFGYLPLCLSSILFGALPSVAAELDHTPSIVEEIVVTSTLHRTQADTTLPVNVLTGETLRERVGATLGDTLQDQIGVTTASFGAGVGAPVIRGQGGNRVQVLQGGVGNIDASAISADHANSLEPALAERIEVLRGPSTLLYGNGAIGGVVNVIDNRIPTELPRPFEGLIETRHNSASDQQVSVMKLEGGAGGFAWHLDGVRRDSNDITFAGYAINPSTVDISDSEALEQLLDSRGRLANSSTAAESMTFGLSRILDDGYFGFSVNRLDNNYGIPLAAHLLHDEDEEENDHDEDADAEDTHSEGGVRIVMKQERADFEARIPLSGFFEEVHGKVSHVDYQHKEVEGTGEVGTVYKQDGTEGRFSLHFSTSATSEGALGLQFSQRKFSAQGEEAFIPPTDIDSLALFAVQSFEIDNRIYEFGLRAEQQKLAQAQGGCDNSDLSWSGSASSIWRVRDDTNLVMSLAHSQRSATVEERYSNIAASCTALPIDDLIAHAATQRLEIGNPRANKESSTNLEFGLRRHLGALTGEFNVYYNDVADFIYLFDTELFADDVEISRYLQQDAVFRGVEAEINIPVRRLGDHLTEMSLFGDYVRASFNNGGNVPQIPPLSAGVELSHSHVHWQAKLRLTRYADQDRTAGHESSTDGYTLLSLYADYHLQFGSNTAYLFLKGSNLLDATVRHHTSLLKDIAPAPGRAIEAGIRWEF